MPTWNAATTYVAGNQLTHRSTLYRANDTLKNVQPGRCPACGSYTDQGACSTNSAANSPAALASRGGLGAVLSRATFEEMFPRRNSIFTYEALLAAAASFPSFASQGSVMQRRQELAAFFANIGHETSGGWPNAPDGPEAWGLYFAQEAGCENGQCTGYCVPSTQWPCVAGRTYHGRGPVQLSYNFNYGPAGRALGVDLLQDPDLVATDGTIAFKTAIWLWTTTQPPRSPCDSAPRDGWTQGSPDVALGAQPGFGMTINVVDGSLECQRPSDARASDRVAFYQRFTGMLGVSTSGDVYCDTMAHY